MNIFANHKTAVDKLSQLSDDFVLIQNPDYVFPEYEVTPLAPKLTAPLQGTIGVVMDMDGTTTTTEELCIFSLEYMVRQMSGLLTKEVWEGLNHNDYPFIIGNSTTKHVEYLISKYQHTFQRDAMLRAYFYSVIWTLNLGHDEGRKKEVRDSLAALNCKELLESRHFVDFLAIEHSQAETDEFTDFIKNVYGNRINPASFSELVRIGIDIYYQKYHQILRDLDLGRRDDIIASLSFESGRKLIEPMPAIGIFIALIKGWLEDDIVRLIPQLLDSYRKKMNKDFTVKNMDLLKKDLLDTSDYFKKNPAKLAVVTSSIAYEAQIVLQEVYNVLQEEVRAWEISHSRKLKIEMMFSRYREIYDGIITASDSNEIRLKPHRDLYSIALHTLSIPKKDFSKVIGFEDSESGSIAIRAAGIGRCVVVPFNQTSGHNFNASSLIAEGGLAEVILKNSELIYE
ncbi:MAG: hypothetical protein GX452_10385 [Ignavibacteriales bacterium]|nr:hypothetical protein [Ignavibacteriales bacterium]HOJ18179.1 hypothetical protein [Ignavibacteriaceae bacterium]